MTPAVATYPNMISPYHFTTSYTTLHVHTLTSVVGRGTMDTSENPQGRCREAGLCDSGGKDTSPSRFGDGWGLNMSPEDSTLTSGQVRGHPRAQPPATTPRSPDVLPMQLRSQQQPAASHRPALRSLILISHRTSTRKTRPRTAPTRNTGKTLPRTRPYAAAGESSAASPTAPRPRAAFRAPRLRGTFCGVPAS